MKVDVSHLKTSDFQRIINSTFALQNSTPRPNNGQDMQICGQFYLFVLGFMDSLRNGVCCNALETLVIDQQLDRMTKIRTSVTQSTIEAIKMAVTRQNIEKMSKGRKVCRLRKISWQEALPANPVKSHYAIDEHSTVACRLRALWRMAGTAVGSDRRNGWVTRRERTIE